MADSYFWANAIFGTIEILVIIIFSFFTFKYIRYFKMQVEPFALGCFSFVLLTAMTKIVPRFVIFVLNSVYVNTSDEEFKAWYRGAESNLNCGLRMTSILPNCLFTIAILINATRWMILILHLQETGSGLKIRKRTIIFSIVLLTTSLIMLIVTVIRLDYACNHSRQEPAFQQVINLYASVLLIFNFFTVLVYMYVAYFMWKYNKKQISQFTDPDQVKEMEVQDNQLKWFFITMIACVIIRQFINAIYDFTQNLIQYTVDQIAVLIDFIYLAEIVLIILLSQSIKETVKTNKHMSTLNRRSDQFIKFPAENVDDLRESIFKPNEQLDSSDMKQKAFETLDGINIRPSNQLKNQDSADTFKQYNLNGDDRYVDSFTNNK